MRYRWICCFLEVFITFALIINTISISFASIHYLPPYRGASIGSNCAASGTAIIRWDEKDCSASQGLWRLGHAWEAYPGAGAAACHTYGRMEGAEITADCDGFRITANFEVNGRSVAFAAGAFDGVGHGEWRVRVYVNVFDENTQEETNSAGYIWSDGYTNPLPVPVVREHIFEDETASDTLSMSATIGHTYLVHGAIDVTTSGYAGLAGISGGENNFWNYTESSSIELTSLSVTKIHNIVISSAGGGTTYPLPRTYGQDEGEIISVEAFPFSGYSFSHWLLDGTTYTTNPISVVMSSHHTLSAHFTDNGPPPPPPGGGGCPFVFVWNGSQFVADNNILSASELSNATDGEDFYRLEQTLVPVHSGTWTSIYALKLGEFEREHSYLDRVRLIGVDHDPSVKIAVTAGGEILTYRDPFSPLSCIDNYGNDRLNEIRHEDGDVSNPATYFFGVEDDSLILNFGVMNASNAKLILRDDLKCEDICIEVQVPDGATGWRTIEVLHPRDYWSVEAVNLSAYMPSEGDFLLRLLWTAPHRLDYVGLDTTNPGDYMANTGQLMYAVHSEEGNVRPELILSDDSYAGLLPGEEIWLAFALPNPEPNKTRTFIFQSEGHYNTIET